MNQTDHLTQNAKEKASSVPEAEVQRELLAQLYILNHFQTRQSQTMREMKSHLLFYTVILSVMVGLMLIAFISIMDKM